MSSDTSKSTNKSLTQAVTDLSSNQTAVANNVVNQLGKWGQWGAVGMIGVVCIVVVCSLVGFGYLLIKQQAANLEMVMTAHDREIDLIREGMAELATEVRTNRTQQRVAWEKMGVHIPSIPTDPQPAPAPKPPDKP